MEGITTDNLGMWIVNEYVGLNIFL